MIRLIPWTTAIAAALFAIGCAGADGTTSPDEDGQDSHIGSSSEAWTVTYPTYFGVNAAHGGSGGQHIIDMLCPANQVLIGVHGGYGNAIDRMGIICGTMNGNGAITGTNYLPTEVGGTGGNTYYGIPESNPYVQDAICPANRFVSGIAYGVGGGVITRIQLACSSVVSGALGYWQVAGNWSDGLQADNCNVYGGTNAVGGVRLSYQTLVDSAYTYCRELKNP